MITIILCMVFWVFGMLLGSWDGFSHGYEAGQNRSKDDGALS